MSRRPAVVGCSLGNCVHVAGVLNFLDLARRNGYAVEFLGAAVPVSELVDAVRSRRPELVAVSYRLSPEPARQLLEELRRELAHAGLENQRMCFGGTPPVAQVARESGLFEAVFDGTEGSEAVAAYLRGEAGEKQPQDWGETLLERISRKSPVPILRHHFGQPTVEATVEGARRIAEGAILDVLSIGPDQNAQEHFFRPEEMDPALDGAGGVPLRTPTDLRAIYDATRCGNYPLLRCYSGTRDLIKWAEVQVETINNAWAAIPLCWYNALDRRSGRPVQQAIEENLQAMAWYAERDIPVECNEAHHWSLRWAHDTIAVAAAFLGAYNAKKVGVRTYVAQYMFNTPAPTSFAMDLAKMLAKLHLIESLHDDNFVSVRQTRAGLMSLSPNPYKAKGQLAASTVLQLQLSPAIVHVVGYCEADHVATSDEVIESCRIVQGVIDSCLADVPDMAVDGRVQDRKAELLEEASILLDAIAELDCGCGDAWACPRCLSKAIRIGLLDAPHLSGNPNAAGRLVTGVVDGAIRALHPQTGRPISERERLELVRRA